MKVHMVDRRDPRACAKTPESQVGADDYAEPYREPEVPEVELNEEGDELGGG